MRTHSDKLTYCPAHHESVTSETSSWPASNWQGANRRQRPRFSSQAFPPVCVLYSDQVTEETARPLLRLHGAVVNDAADEALVLLFSLTALCSIRSEFPETD